MAENKSNAIELPRVFKYQSLTLDDVDPDMKPEEIKEYYAGIYPELTQSVIEGPNIEGDAVVFKFVKSVGTKQGRRQPVIKPALGIPGCKKLQSFSIHDIAKGKATFTGPTSSYLLEEGHKTLELMEKMASAMSISNQGIEAPSEILEMI